MSEAVDHSESIIPVHPVTIESSPADLMAYIEYLERKLECDRIHAEEGGTVGASGPSQLVAITLDRKGRHEMLAGEMDGVSARNATIEHLTASLGKAVERIQYLEGTLDTIAAMGPATTDMSLANEMAQIAAEVLDPDLPDGTSNALESLVTSALSRGWIDAMKMAVETVKTMRVSIWGSREEAARSLIVSALESSIPKGRPDRSPTIDRVLARIKTQAGFKVQAGTAAQLEAGVDLADCRGPST